MYRKIIKDHRKKRAPRVCDYVREEDGTEIIEIKFGKIIRTILVQDLEEQIQAAKAT